MNTQQHGATEVRPCLDREPQGPLRETLRRFNGSSSRDPAEVQMRPSSIEQCIIVTWRCSICTPFLSHPYRCEQMAYGRTTCLGMNTPQHDQTSTISYRCFGRGPQGPLRETLRRFRFKCAYGSTRQWCWHNEHRHGRYRIGHVCYPAACRWTSGWMDTDLGCALSTFGHAAHCVH